MLPRYGVYQIDDSTATKESVENRVKDEIPTYIFKYSEFENVDSIDSVIWTDYPGSIPTAELDQNSPIPGAHKKVDYHFNVNVTMEDDTTKMIPVIATIEFE